MANFAYAIASDGSRRSITVFANGEVLVASDDRADFDTIVAKATDGDDSVIQMFDPASTVTKKFVRLTDRVSLKNGQILFDHDPIDDAVSAAILRAIEAGEDDWAPLVNFLEKLYSNPNEHSRKQAYRWLATHKFVIAADGDILGYKAVQSNYNSVHSGTAVVDGETIVGEIPNKVGSVIEMPRSEVQFDPSVGCHTGLHVGTWSYARGFHQGKYLLVKFNPRDIVSVPTDCSDAKVRVCRYTVVEEITGELEIDGPIHWDYDDNYQSDFHVLDVDELLA